MAQPDSVPRNFANRTAALSIRLLFGPLARIHVLHAENASRPGGFLLAANHISHFDPFIISSIARRKIDWMAMAEFFLVPLLGLFLRAVDAFPADRDRADRETIRTAIARLKLGRIVGIFPEGGIRDGARSLLEGAPLRPGVSTLAHMAGVPIVPCVILGSDRFYAKKNWLPYRRTAIWIGFGEPISGGSDVEKFKAREGIDNDLAAAFKNLYAELKDRFQLTPDDLPHSPQERFGVRRSRDRPTAFASSPSQIGRAADADISAHSMLARFRATALDSVMCASMNLLQARHPLPARSREEMERYIKRCERLTAQEFYAPPPAGEIADRIDHRFGTISWRSPIETSFPANNIARVELFPSRNGWNAPTVLMLHALLSATRIGYRRRAAYFNALGWNACFVHLPYHYSRVPRGYWNGELAITANLIRNAEGLRQGVVELRQLMAALRRCGCPEFGILGTSYGGWIGALVAMVERDFRFVALMAPIVNVEHAIWENPATRLMRHHLRRARIERELVAQHFHLSSPAHNQPLCDPERILFVAGEYDSIARVSDIEAIREKWRGSELLRVSQGHFGYQMLRKTVTRLEERGSLKT